MEIIWNNPRKKPKQYEYVLAETDTKHCSYRICYMLENGVWRDAYEIPYCSLNNLRVKCTVSDFRVKRWAHINDIE